MTTALFFTGASFSGIPHTGLTDLQSPDIWVNRSQDLKQIQADYGIKVVPVELSKPEDVTKLLPMIIRTNDALFISGSNIVNSQILTIMGYGY
jgi:hypothetical protein